MSRLCRHFRRIHARHRQQAITSQRQHTLLYPHPLTGLKLPTLAGRHLTLQQVVVIAQTLRRDDTPLLAGQPQQPYIHILGTRQRHAFLLPGLRPRVVGISPAARIYTRVPANGRASPSSL